MKDKEFYSAKDKHNWRHVIGCRNENPDLALELYICKDCGAVLLRKWGHEMIITHNPEFGLNQLKLQDIAGGLKFDERRHEWEES